MIATSELAPRSRAHRLIDEVTRPQLYAGTFLLCFLNGIYPRIMLDVAEEGWGGALMNTFGISVLVWAAIVLGLRQLLLAEPRPVQRGDWPNVAAVALATMVPVAAVSWLAMGWLAWCLVSKGTDREQRVGWIFLALTFPMFWSREFFSLFSEWILQIEAALVGTVMGSPHSGNLVEFADGSGYLQIWPACSSFANVSLAVLCWSLFSNLSHAEVDHNYRWCLLACVAVVAINAARISLIGFFPSHYDLLHGPTGTSVAGWTTLLGSLLVCYLGTRDTGRRRPGFATAEPTHA